VNLLLIAIGGAIGSVLRYLLSTVVLRASGAQFPFGTFTVNIVGCIVFGAIVGMASTRPFFTPALRAFLLTGLLGGFTTFSSFAYESVVLVQDRRVLAAAANIVGQIVAGLMGLWAGYAALSW
jgi:CrcB protein